MSIDAILDHSGTFKARTRIARLEAALRHYYYKAHRMEYPTRIVVRGGKVTVVTNTSGAHHS